MFLVSAFLPFDHHHHKKIVLHGIFFFSFRLLTKHKKEKKNLLDQATPCCIKCTKKKKLFCLRSAESRVGSTAEIFFGVFDECKQILFGAANLIFCLLTFMCAIFFFHVFLRWKICGIFFISFRCFWNRLRSEQMCEGIWGKFKVKEKWISEGN